MSNDRWWWAQKAQQLRFAQLDVARRQAEIWRTGLAGVTALFGAVFIIKGRSDVTDLAAPYPIILVALYGAALITLVTATLLAIRAASGAPGDECLLTGEDLESWTNNEVRRVERAIRAACVLTIAAISALAVGVGTTWLAPSRPPADLTVWIETRQGQYCGQLTQLGNDTISIASPAGNSAIPLTSVIQIHTMPTCTP